MRERLDVIGGGISIESASRPWNPGHRVGPAGGPLPLRPHGPNRGKPWGPAASEGAIESPRRRSACSWWTTMRWCGNGIALQLHGQADIEVVGEASDGATAVELVRTLQPDVITMDVNMPGMDGIEATRLIHAEHPSGAHHRALDVGRSGAGKQR